MRGVVSEFADCVQAHDQEVPFVRSRQNALHRAMIDRRRAHPSVRDAIDDEAFVDLLYRTLRAWGIGRRASRLVSRADFGAALGAQADTFAVFEQTALDDSELDVDGVGAGLWGAIEALGIVTNVSLLVPGSKTLHHLLPGLMPPMDRAWTGVFFIWSAAAPQSGQHTTFTRTFARCAEIARRASPARYVGEGWRTCPSKIVDNAIIGYCKIHQMVPARNG